MMTYLIWVLAAFGLSFVVGFSKISLPFREWLELSTGRLGAFLLELLECPACFGFWEGLAAGLAFGCPAWYAAPWWTWPIALALATSGSNWILAVASRLMKGSKDV